MELAPYEEFVEYTEYGSEKYVLRCPKCGTELAVIYRSGSAYQISVYDSGCPHYIWEPIGNGCYENPTHPLCMGTYHLLKRAVKVYQDGTTVWLLVPRS